VTNLCRYPGCSWSSRLFTTPTKTIAVSSSHHTTHYYGIYCTPHALSTVNPIVVSRVVAARNGNCLGRGSNIFHPIQQKSRNTQDNDIKVPFFRYLSLLRNRPKHDCISYNFQSHSDMAARLRHNPTCRSCVVAVS
jgi:hypothetical protein